MPWWAYLYLSIYWLLSFGGIYDDMQRPHKATFITGELLSAIFVTIFVAAYFYNEIARQLGKYIFVMLFFGFIYELVAVQRVINDNKHDPEFNEKELFYLNNISLISGNLFIVPGYVFGLMAGISNTNL